MPRRRAVEQLISKPVGPKPKLITLIGSASGVDVSDFVGGVSEIVQAADFDLGVNQISAVQLEVNEPDGFFSSRHKHVSLVPSKSPFGTECYVSLQFPSIDGSLGLFAGKVARIAADEGEASVEVTVEDRMAEIFDHEVAAKVPEEDVANDTDNDGEGQIINVKKFPFTTKDDRFEVEFTDEYTFTVASSYTHATGSLISTSHVNTITWSKGERVQYLQTVDENGAATGQAFNLQSGVSASRIHVAGTEIREASLDEDVHFRVMRGRAFIERLTHINAAETWAVNFSVGGMGYVSDGGEVEFELDEADGFFETGDKFSFETRRIFWFGRQRSRIAHAIGSTDLTVGVYEPRKFDAGDMAVIDDETVLVGSIGSTQIAITRAQSNSFARAHSLDAEILNDTQSLQTPYALLVDNTYGLLTNTGYGYGYTMGTELDSTSWSRLEAYQPDLKYEGHFEQAQGVDVLNEILEPINASLRILPSGKIAPNVHFPPAPPLDLVRYDLGDSVDARMEEDQERFYNSLTIKYGPKLKQSITEDYTASVDLYGSRPGQDVEYKILQENQDDELRNVALRRLHVHSEPLRVFSFDPGVAGLLVDLADYLYIQGTNIPTLGVRLRERSVGIGQSRCQLTTDQDHILDQRWGWIGSGNANLHLTVDITGTAIQTLHLLRDWHGYFAPDDETHLTMVGEVIEVDDERMLVQGVDTSTGVISVERAHGFTTAATHSYLDTTTEFTLLQTVSPYEREWRFDQKPTQWDVLKIGLERVQVELVLEDGRVWVNRRFRGTVDGTADLLPENVATTDKTIEIAAASYFQVGDVCRITDGSTWEECFIEAVDDPYLQVLRAWHGTARQAWTINDTIYVSRFGHASALKAYRHRPVKILTHASTWAGATERDKDYCYCGSEDISGEPDYRIF